MNTPYHSHKYLRPCEISPSWQYWYEKICAINDVDPSELLSEQPLPHPWFLFPEHVELSDEEFDSLVETVRSYLLSGSDCSVSVVRHRMERLGPEASIPFLYLMRYVAFREAGRHYYWPPFQKTLFDDVLTYDNVAVGLASTTSRLWQILYLHTKGALYFPLEGPVNIKWPLAHAGLLPDHKAVLREFGVDLLSADETDSLFRETVDLSGQEFGLRYRDWIRSNPQYRDNAFSSVVFSTRRERLVLIELAQKWLDYSLPDLQELLAGGARPSQRLVSPRRYLSYRIETKQLGIIFKLGRLPRHPNAQLRWNERVVDLQYHDFVQGGEREFMDEFLPLTGQKWPSNAQLVLAGSAPIEIELPILQRKSGTMSGVVFDPITGAQTKRWHLGREYYVLVDSKAIAKTSPDNVFSEWFDYGEPRGEWPDYRILWVRTKSPEEIEDAELSALEDLEVATDKLALPSFEQQLRPRIRLIGGRHIGDAADGTPNYEDNAPPYLEIAGRWMADLDVILNRSSFAADLIDRQEISRLHLPAPEDGASRIIALWQDCHQTGLYMLELGNEQLLFQLCGSETDEKESISRLRLELKVYQEGAEVKHINRHSLSSASLLVKTWPGAELQLSVKDRTGNSSVRHTIQSGDIGVWEAELGDIAINWNLFAPGDLLLEVCWRGLFAQDVLISDTSFINADDLRINIRPIHRRRYSVVCTGVIKGHPPGVRLIGYLLPQVPWKSQAHQFELIVKSNGRFAGESSAKWKPSWLVIGKPGPLNDLNEQPIVVRSLLDDNQQADRTQYILADLDFRHAEAWSSLADRIAAHAYPPELEPYISTAPSILLLKRLCSFLSTTQRWRSIRSWQDWEQLLPVLKVNSKVALFWRRVPEGSDAQDVQYATLTSKPESYRRGKLNFRFDGCSTSGSLVKVKYGETDRIALKSSTTLYACMDCHLILPMHAFKDHRAAFSEYPDCTQQKAKYFAYVPGDPDPMNSVSVAVLWNMAEETARFRNYLLGMLEKKRQPDECYKRLFTEFQELIPKGTSPSNWLSGLVTALGRLIQLSEIYQKRRSVTLTFLCNIAQPIMDYEDAVFQTLTFLSDPSTINGSLVIEEPSIPTPEEQIVHTPGEFLAQEKSKPPPEPPKSRIRTQKQIHVLLTARDRQALEDCLCQIKNELESEYQVKGPYRLKDRRTSACVYYRSYISVPMLAQYGTVLRHMKLPPGVKFELSTGVPF